MTTRSDPLEMWTLYERPADYPQGYVARRWVIGEGTYAPTSDAFFGATLEEVTDFFDRCYPDLFYLPRQDGDEAQIVGTWL
jgi:hypothetical protein